MIAPIFRGGRVFIVGGGPSLTGFNFARLDGQPTIAVNRAYEVLPSAWVLWWSDVIFWRKHRDAILAHRGLKATALYDYSAEDYPPADQVSCYKFTGCTGFDPNASRLRHGNNSAYAAMHLAAHLGAKKIVLLGVDMRFSADHRSHWHDGYPQPAQPETYTQLMLPWFKTLADPLAERGIEVLNASPDSALTVWRRCSIEEGLAS